MGKTLVVAEKPSAGADMAKVLGCTQRKQGYIEGENYIVTWGIGHLVGLKGPEEHDQGLKQWSLESLPFRFPIRDSLKVLPGTSKQFEIVKKLIQSPEVDSVINAGDAGREGYLIQEWIYRLSGNRKPVKVLWASSLTEEALKKAFRNLHERGNFQNLLLEAEARAEADWMLGMNYTRGLTLTKGKNKVLLRYGRCQTSLLNLLVKRECEIEQFTPKPYYEIWREYEEGFWGVFLDENESVKRFEGKEEAEMFMAAEETQGLTVKTYDKQLKKVEAPALFNLADLQKEMGSKYGYDAEKTLSAAQSLYEKHKLLSYPRTDSRVMSSDLAAEIMEHVESVLPLLMSDTGAFTGCSHFADTIRRSIPQLQKNKRYVNDVKVTDHHALVPTINREAAVIYKNNLNEAEQNVFTEVVKRFLSIFLPEYTYISVRLTAETEKGSKYESKGKTVMDSGWRSLYAMEKTAQKFTGEEEKAEVIPSDINMGSELHTKTCLRKDKMTQAPSRYTVSSIISLMEKYGIGTSATRAEIIKKLMNENSPYITLNKGKYFATALGKTFIGLLPEELKTENLTIDFEQKLSLIESGKLEKEQFLNDVFLQISNNLEQFKQSKEVVDVALGDRQTGKADAALYCPFCNKSVYKGKYGWYCSGYREGCKMSIPLEIAHKKVTDSVAKQLTEKRLTGVLKGFKKKDGTTFSAKLRLDENGKTGFAFDSR